MRYGSRRDFAHWDVKGAFEKMGAYVVDLADVGGGVPDLLVILDGKNHLVEVKTARGVRATAYGKKGLSASQDRFVSRSGAVVDVACDLEDVAVLMKRWSKKR